MYIDYSLHNRITFEVCKMLSYIFVCRYIVYLCLLIAYVVGERNDCRLKL